MPRQSAVWPFMEETACHSQCHDRSSPAGNLSRSQWRVISLASLGGSSEYYDFIIYGIFAQYIARQFFPASDPVCVSDPVLLGAGDRLSCPADRRDGAQRARRSLRPAAGVPGIAVLHDWPRRSWSVCCPRTKSWGLVAPLLLGGLRLVQGICLGGELPGALTYTAEAAPQRSGLACGVIILCVNGSVREYWRTRRDPR